MHADMEKVISHYDSSSSVHVATAQCESNSGSGTGKALCDSFNLPYYPYIIYGNSGTKSGEYNGARSYADMVSFIDNHYSGVPATDLKFCDNKVVV